MWPAIAAPGRGLAPGAARARGARARVGFFSARCTGGEEEEEEEEEKEEDESPRKRGRGGGPGAGRPRRADKADPGVSPPLARCVSEVRDAARQAEEEEDEEEEEEEERSRRGRRK